MVSVRCSETTIPSSQTYKQYLYINMLTHTRKHRNTHKREGTNQVLACNVATVGPCNMQKLLHKKEGKKVHALCNQVYIIYHILYNTHYVAMELPVSTPSVHVMLVVVSYFLMLYPDASPWTNGILSDRLSSDPSFMSLFLWISFDLDFSLVLRW